MGHVSHHQLNDEIILMGILAVSSPSGGIIMHRWRTAKNMCTLPAPNLFFCGINTFLIVSHPVQGRRRNPEGSDAFKNPYIWWIQFLSGVSWSLREFIRTCAVIALLVSRYIYSMIISFICRCLFNWGSAMFKRRDVLKVLNRHHSCALFRGSFHSF